MNEYTKFMKKIKLYPALLDFLDIRTSRVCRNTIVCNVFVYTFWHFIRDIIFFLFFKINFKISFFAAICHHILIKNEKKSRIQAF